MKILAGDWVSQGSYRSFRPAPINRPWVVDDMEVQNYIAALNHAVASLGALPFTSRLIREAHRVLMRGVRGAQKQPGEFRTSQSWIGGATIDDAVFVPPAHACVPELLADLERFFLIGVVETAKSGIATFDGILRLQKEIEERVRALGSRAGKAGRLIHYLYRRPRVDAARVSEVAGVSMPTSYKLIQDLERLGILREITGAQRGRMYLFDAYVNLFRS